jgi:hypothetical protein
MPATAGLAAHNTWGIQKVTFPPNCTTRPPPVPLTPVPELMVLMMIPKLAVPILLVLGFEN